jgi:DNA-binding response OmpR family regulator
VTWLGSTRFDAGSQALLRGDQRVHLRFAEKQLLSVLIAGQGKCVPLTVIRSTLWDHLVAPPVDKTLDVIVHRLRARLAEIAPGVQLERVHGIGIRLVTPERPAFCPLCGGAVPE